MTGTPDARLNQLLRQLEPSVRRSFIDAVRKSRNSVSIPFLIGAIERNATEQAVSMLDIRQEVLYPLGESVRSAYIQGGTSVSVELPGSLSARFGFGTNPIVDEQIATITGNLIEDIRSDSREAIRYVVSYGLSNGIRPRSLAYQIVGKGRNREGGFLGLSSDLTKSIIRGQVKLSSGYPKQMKEYLRLDLRNKNKDHIVRKAIKEGRALTLSEIDEVITAHKNKALGYRGRRIARTETMNALRAGKHAGYVQLQRMLPNNIRIEQTWKVNRDGRERFSHDLLGDTTIQLGEFFVSPITGARMRFPGDTSSNAPGEEIIQCRCSSKYKVVVE